MDAGPDVAAVLSAWDGEDCMVRFDRATGAWFVIAVHSTRLGPASGGTRATVYPTVGHAVADATRLAGAMTTKMAVAGLPRGGGKSVIALPAPRSSLDDATWRRILTLHAENLERLGGSYTTGPDIGTTAADMDVMGERTRHVLGRSAAAGGPGSGAPATALGVFAAVRAAAAEAGLGPALTEFATANPLGGVGAADLHGLRVLVQGLGEVGGRVADLVRAAGAELVVADVDARRVGRHRGARVVDPDRVTRTPCDVLVPCALGGVLDRASAATVPCAAVAGAANNQLVDDETAEVLRDRGIVHAPDFVANAGGAIHLVGREVLGWTAAEVARRTLGIGATLQAVFAEARLRGVTPDRAAHDLAARRLAAVAA